MQANEGFIKTGEPSVMLFFQTINATSSSCQERWKICLVLNLRLYFEDFESGTKLLDLTIDGYGEQIVKILI